MKKGRLTIKQTAKPTRKPSSKRTRSEKLTPATAAEVPAIVDEVSLLSDLRSLIQAARQRVATVANSTQTMLYWSVGRRLLRENLQDGRAAYGKRILATLSRESLSVSRDCVSKIDVGSSSTETGTQDEAQP